MVPSPATLPVGDAVDWSDARPGSVRQDRDVMPPIRRDAGDTRAGWEPARCIANN